LTLEALTEQQRIRLQQLALQQRGPRAFLQPETQKALGLTEKQVQGLPQVMKDFESDLDKIAGRVGGGPGSEARAAEAARAVNDAHRRGLAGMQALLNDAQKKLYADLVGPPLAGLRLDMKYLSLMGGANFRRTPPATSLLGEALVRSDLALTPEQVAKVGGVPAAAAAAHKELTDKLAAAESAHKDRDAAAKKALRIDEEKALVALVSADQARRYRQIVVQRLGLIAFEAPPVLAALKLSDDDKAALDRLRTAEAETLAKATAALEAEASKAPTRERTKAQEAARKQAEELRGAALAKVVATLPAPAQKRWADLVGPPFAYVPEPRAVPGPGSNP
jgi:hypothetical protein